MSNGGAIAPLKRVRANRIELDGSGATEREQAIAVETPVELVIGSFPFAVMMLSPVDVEDFVVGFCLTEGIIERASDVTDIEIEAGASGMRASVELAGHLLSRHLARRRAISGRTGCGVCGVEDLAALVRRPLSLPAPIVLAPASVSRALAELEEHQLLNRETRAVHGAAWVDQAGHVLRIREDVGRHNALDKLIGCLARECVDPAAGFVLITSRCSFEMIDKTAAFGASTIVAISAPTSFALDRAEALGLQLLAIARRDAVTAFTTGARRQDTPRPGCFLPEIH